MIEALIFDMDGLLVDSEPYWDEARKMLIDECGITWEWNPEDQGSVMGRSTSQWVGYMIERFHLDLTPKEVEEGVIANMVKLYRGTVPFLPGATQVVSLAADTEHLRSGLASGSPWRLIETVTENPYLQGKFEVILSGDQFDRGKPAPDIYLAAANQLEIAPENCLCFEDSGNGILAGKAAGMKVAAIPDERFSPGPELLAEADMVLSSLLEFSLETLDHL
jgi:beta-phosphoglucomutase-like phosphatase (HAD superfamily)